MANDRGDGGLVFLSFVVGALVGGILGVLFAPKSGKEMREDLAAAAGDARREVEKFVKETRGRLEGLVEDTRAAVAKGVSKETGEV